MSDEHKSEQASSHKLKEARKQGQTFKSMELNGWLLLLISVAYLAIFSGEMASQLKLIVVQHIGDQLISPNNNINNVSGDLLFNVIGLLIPFFSILIIFSIGINILTKGWVFSAAPLKPKFEKMNPIKGFKKLFSKKNLFELVKQVLKLVVVVALLVWIFPTVYYHFVNASSSSSLDELGNVFLQEMIRVAALILAITIPLVLLDILFSKWDFSKQMMMSKREVKDEHKKREGDPQIKSKRKEKQNELGKKLKSLSTVKTADVVVNNPTHIAVAIKFDPQTMVAPIVTSSGRGLIGQFIRKEAARHGVAQITDIPLARGIYKNIKIGHPITPEYYQGLAPFYRQLLNVGATQ
ncbi:EscU/YscU/HrcU family type III secretion system export apparatus switch protein [Aestuariibacter sp. AA17]|uniref:Flagellar biosynthetic protein FlhB n=1 Tax=Fluctibacter corallii TaxID=2984329 RepID=A0ABT3A9H1_9ALTE|nr:EscU/YscU/HrcU family type III secretion system export apparatus switch protein [Aestuariibacter sp. AA17]MCV2885325.1 EscU/YscU/HrcU family type III secretion system export apparatus switch protein [Aestuariibacter sp. AA17]